MDPREEVAAFWEEVEVAEVVRDLLLVGELALTFSTHEEKACVVEEADKDSRGKEGSLAVDIHMES
jgi:hypothetical protein